MAKYDLTNSLEKSFTFSISGKEYDFRKPTVREMRQIVSKFSDISENSDTQTQLKQNDETMEEIYKFITPIGHDTPIGQLMEEQTVAVQIAFNEMVQAELGAK